MFACFRHYLCVLYDVDGGCFQDQVRAIKCKGYLLRNMAAVENDFNWHIICRRCYRIGNGMVPWLDGLFLFADVDRRNALFDLAG